MPLLQYLESRLPKSTFWRNVTLVAGGSAAGQALSVAASPVLSRLYLPGDFGLLSVYASAISIVAVVGSFSYQQAIPAPESDTEGANLTVLSLGLVAITSLLTALVIVIFHARLEHYFGIPGFTKYIAAVPLGVFGVSAYEVLSQWAARKKAFGLIAKTSAQRSVVQTVSQLVGGFAGFGTAGLVVGQLFGQWGGTVQVARKSWRDDSAEFRAVTARSIAATAAHFRRFPMFTLPGSVLNAIDANSAPLLLAHFFGATVTGYYALGNRLVMVPFMLVGSSVQRVFYPAAAAAKHAGTLAVETEETYQRLLRIVLPIICVLTACAPELFVVLMGRDWREAGVYLQWMSLRSCFTMLVFPLTPLIYVLDRQAIGTLFSGVQLVVRVGALYIGSRRGDPHLSVALLGIGTGTLWLIYLGYLLAISGNRLASAIWPLTREAAIALAISSPILAAKLLHAGDRGVTLIAAVVSAVAAIIVIRRSFGYTKQRAELPS